MAHKLLRLRNEVFNKPQLLNVTEFQDVVQYLNDRNNSPSFKTMFVDGDTEDSYEFTTVNQETSTAVIDFNGMLTYKPMFNMATCGMGLSYQTLKSVFTDLLEDGIKNISMIVNSGGGQAYGCFDSANYVRELLSEYGATLTAFVDGNAFSAAYAWVSVADEIVMTRDSEVGSIGVVIQLINDSKALEKEGYERTFVYSGNSKIPFTTEGEFTEEFISNLQKSCDELYEEFINHVSEHRGIDKALVRGTQANTFSSKDAIELGLADKVMTFEEFMEYLADKSPNKEAQVSKGYLGRFLNSEKEGVNTRMAELKKLQEEMGLVVAEKEQMLSELTQLKGKLEELQGVVEEKEASEQAAQKALAEAQQEAAEKLLAERKAKLSAVLPEDQVEAHMEALGALDEAQFNAVVSTFATMKGSVADSALMKELGDEGTSLEVEETSDMEKLDALTKQYLK